MEHTFGNFEFMQGFAHPYSSKEVHGQLPRATAASSYPATSTYLNSGEEPVDLADFLAISSSSSINVKQELYRSPPPTYTDSSLQYTQPNFGINPRQVILTGRMDQMNLAQGVETVVEQVFVSEGQQEGGSGPGKMPRARPSQVVVGKKLIDKNSDEYRRRRERNNVAVRRSRDKTRHKREETEKRVVELEEENQKLREKLTLLNKEINVLKSLFSSVGVPASSSSATSTTTTATEL